MGLSHSWIGEYFSNQLFMEKSKREHETGMPKLWRALVILISLFQPCRETLGCIWRRENHWHDRYNLSRGELKRVVTESTSACVCRFEAGDVEMCFKAVVSECLDRKHPWLFLEACRTRIGGKGCRMHKGLRLLRCLKRKVLVWREFPSIRRARGS